MNLRAQIMAMPERDRLEAALTLLDDLTGQNGAEVARLGERFGLTQLQARFVAALNARAPEFVASDALLSAVWGYREVNPTIITVVVHQVRPKLPVAITNRHGFGYRLDRKIDLARDFGGVAA